MRAPSTERKREGSVGVQESQTVPNFPFAHEADRLNRDRVPQRIVHGKG